MDGHQANGAFVAAGPPGFTALALIKLGAKAQEMYALFLVCNPPLPADFDSRCSLPAAVCRRTGS